MAPSFLPSSVGYLTEKKGMNKLSEGGGDQPIPTGLLFFLSLPSLSKTISVCGNERGATFPSPPRMNECCFKIFLDTLS